MSNQMSAAWPRRHTTSRATSPALSSRQANSLFDRYEVIDLVRKARRDLGLTHGDVSVLAAHLSTQPKGPIDASRPVLSYMAVQTICERANGMDPRCFRRGELNLVRAGLVRRNLSANCRRYPIRNGHETPIAAYGIDLSPLFERLQEIDKLLRQSRETAMRRRTAISVIQALLAETLRNARNGLGNLRDAVAVRIEEIRRLARRKSTSEGDLEELRREAEQIQKNAAVPSIDSETGLQDISDDSAADDSADAVGQFDRRIESRKKESTDCSANRETVLRREIEAAWSKSANIRSYYPKVPRSGSELAEVLEDFSSFIGIDRTLMQRTVLTFGCGGALEVLDDLASRISSIRSVGGYLVTLFKAYDRGETVASGRVRRQPQALT